MKHIGKWLLRVIALAVAITLVVFFWPQISSFLGSLFPKPLYSQTSETLTHEISKVGELIALRMNDTGIMNTSTSAFIIGEVQRVSVPYAYEIGFGVDTKNVKISATDSGLTVSVPETQMLYDNFHVTGDPKVSDFWYKLSQSRYQDMLDEQSAKCREAYLSREDVLTQAWDATCDALSALFSQYADMSAIPVTFETAAPDLSPDAASSTALPENSASPT